MNVSLDFGNLISRAWQIIWKHKVLWIFGILAGCGSASPSSNGGGGSGGTPSSGAPSSDFPFGGDFFGPLADYFERMDEGLVITFAIIATLVILVLMVIAIVLNTVGRVGLVKGTLDVEAGAERLSFGDLFRASLTYFWRVFGLNLLIGLAVFAVVMVLVIAGVIMTGVTMGLFLICLLPLLCLLVPVMWVINVLVQQINIVIVVEDVGIGAAIQRGWQFFRQNLGNLLVLGLILGVLGLVAGGLISLPMFFVVMPLFSALIIGGESAMGGGLLVSAICLVSYLPVLLVLSGILRSFIDTVWTLAYLRLSRPQAPAAPAPLTPQVPQPPAVETF